MKNLGLRLRIPKNYRNYMDSISMPLKNLTKSRNILNTASYLMNKEIISTILSSEKFYRLFSNYLTRKRTKLLTTE